MSFNSLCISLINSITFKNNILLYVRALLKKDDDFKFWTLNILTNDDFDINSFNSNELSQFLYILILKQFYSKKSKKFRVKYPKTIN